LVMLSFGGRTQSELGPFHTRLNHNHYITPPRLVRCLVENTLGLGRYLGWCWVDGGCLSCDGGTVVPLLDDVNPGAVPLPGEVPVVLGLPQLMAQYHSRFLQARICYLVDVDPGAEPLPGLGWLVG
jgi:hypothetical protein